MNEVLSLLDIGPPGGSIGVVAGIAFFLICIAGAFIAFRLLKRTVKFALRVIVVFVILAIGLFGTLAWFYIGTGGRGPVKPPSAANTRSR